MAIQFGHDLVMKEVNIGDLKSHLSHYLRLVQKGQPVLVLDRNRVVARLEAAGESAATDDDEGRRRSALERKGILRRAHSTLSRKRLDDLVAKAPKTKGDIVAVLLQEREEGL